ncbi:MAG: PE-PPE domain-containing protein [Mycobacterium sp.]|nr:PE-PPE domain-containing protein [Mycobacterium sp.]
MAQINRYSTIGFVIGLCASISVHPTASASAASRHIAFYLQGTCLCDTTPTPQQALGLADGYLASAGTISGIGYPAGLLFAADAAIGTNAVNAELAALPTDSAVTLAGVSQGAIVLNYVKLSRSLQDSHKRPATDNLRFVTFGDPQNTTGGITTKNPALQLFAPNVGVPTAYPTTEIVREYDGFSDWPDRPTHLAVINALMGIAYVHPNYGAPANPMTPGTLKTVNTNAAGGITTHYLVPTTGLPLTQPLRDAGLDAAPIDAWLRPHIDSAYIHRPQATSGSAATPPSPGPAPAKHPDTKPAAGAPTTAEGKSSVAKANSSPATGSPTDAGRQDRGTPHAVSTSSTDAVRPPQITPTSTARGTATETPRLSTDAQAGKTATGPDATPKGTTAGPTAKPSGTADDKASKPKEDTKAHSAPDH